MRYPIFSAPHKALRYALSRLVDLVGKMDIYETKQVDELVNLFNDLYTMIYSHSNHEDEILFNALDAIVPGKTIQDRNEHIRIHDDLDKLKVEIEIFAMNVYKNELHSDDVEILYNTICKLQSDMLIHMLEEESITQPLFWNYMTDEELEAFRPKIMAAMTPDESALWLKYIFASHSAVYVTELLNNIKQTAPEQVYQKIQRIAKGIVSVKQDYALNV